MVSSRIPKAAIVGIEGTALNTAERELFKLQTPFGFILFRRNCVSPDQMRMLVHELCEITGRADTPVLIDQEGGRVARLKAPVWVEFPAPRLYGHAYADDEQLGLRLAEAAGIMMGQQIRAVGCTVNCAPMLDVPTPDSHPGVIGNRVFSDEPAAIIALGRAYADGLRNAGVLPVIKHLPGHGRAVADSHEALPVVDASRQQLEQSDFATFKGLSDLPLAMTAHVLYPALDAENCATLSPRIINDVIRGALGFGGLLLADDLTMKALPGTYAEKTARALAAGCDAVLVNATHDTTVPNSLTITAEVLGAAAPVTAMAHARWAAAQAWLQAAPKKGQAAALTYPQLIAAVNPYEKRAENTGESLVANV